VIGEPRGRRHVSAAPRGFFSKPRPSPSAGHLPPPFHSGKSCPPPELDGCALSHTSPRLSRWHFPFSSIPAPNSTHHNSEEGCPHADTSGLALPNCCGLDGLGIRQVSQYLGCCLVPGVYTIGCWNQGGRRSYIHAAIGGSSYC
jgi:hypothetical protein